MTKPRLALGLGLFFWALLAFILLVLAHSGPTLGVTALDPWTRQNCHGSGVLPFYLWERECTTLSDQRIVLEGPAFNTLADCYRARQILIRSTWRSTDERLSEELDRHYLDA